MFIRKKRGQSILEYAILLGIIVAVIVAIQIYVKRAITGKFKASADQIGDQFTTGQEYSIETIRQTARREQTLATGTPTIEGSAWTESKIQEAGTAAGQYDDWAGNDLGSYVQLGSDYRSAEISKTDYIDTTARTDAAASVGVHDEFDSGQLSTIELFGDDE